MGLILGDLLQFFPKALPSFIAEPEGDLGIGFGDDEFPFGFPRITGRSGRQTGDVQIASGCSWQAQEGRAVESSQPR
jgi:hypothetical protein